MEDKRVVCGAKCTWWDSIDKVKKDKQSGLPVCPYCGNVLFEVSSIEKWNEAVDRYVQSTGFTDYSAYTEWNRGRQCCKTFDENIEQFIKETGKTNVPRNTGY